MSSPGAPSIPFGALKHKRKTKKKHFVQQKVEVFRASDPVLSVLMWGVSHSINDLSQVPVPVMLLPDDFKASTKIKVINHLFNKENLPGQFKFKEYCPQAFRNLRERFGIEDQDYQVIKAIQPYSLEPDTSSHRETKMRMDLCVCKWMHRNGVKQGARDPPIAVSLARSAPLKDEDRKCAGLMLTSYDRSLVIKEISSEEVEEMHSFLSEYHQYIVTCHGSTLLPQFLAMYRVTVESEDTYLLVMRNMFSHRLHTHRKYELKGSVLSREASFKEKVKDLPGHKDADFRNNVQKVYVSAEDKEKLMEKLNRDIEFLVRMRIMDYSLLLGIHDVERAEREEEDVDSSGDEEEEGENGPVPPYSTSPEGIPGYMNSLKPLGPGEFDPYVDVYAIQSAEGAPRREVYFMGLIDVLTQYDTKKKAAHAARAVKQGAGAEISTVHPEQYAKRFRDFFSKIFA